MCGAVPAIDELLTAEHVADVLKVHVTTVYRMATSGRIRALRVGEGMTSPRGLRIPRSALDEFLTASRINPGEAA